VRFVLRPFVREKGRRMRSKGSVSARRIGAAIAAGGLTVVLLWFGTGLFPTWPLMWLAPLPALVFAASASWWTAGAVAAISWAVSCFNLWPYVHVLLHVPATLLMRIFGLEALGFAAAVLLYRALLRRGAVWWALIAFPATRVALEYVVNLTSPHGTNGSLAYTQLGCLPLLQVASLTGPWGVSFLLLLFPATLATAWHLRATRARAVRVLVVGLGAIAAALAFGAVRLALPADGPTVKVGLVASDAPTSPEVADEGAPTAALLDAYATRVAALASQGAQVVVLPEKLGVAVDPETREVDARVQALADQTRAVLVAGLIHVAKPRKYNEARVFVPGAPVTEYHKRHMLPPFESMFEPGRELVLLTRPSGTWGVTICKDMDFTPLSREYGLAGASLLLVPAWDFNIDRAHHGHIAVMRGVESGFAIARAAKNGYLTVSDNRGRILAETRSDTAPFATLLAEVPTTHATTLYQQLGDWFAWLVLALLAATLLQLARSWRQAS
jgi:apolipoprotein N-acyltransferase